MADDDEVAATEAELPVIERLVDVIRRTPPEQIRGTERLGALSFGQDSVDDLNEIASTLEDYLLEDRDFRDDNLHVQVEANAEAAWQVLVGMMGLTSSEPDAATNRADLVTRLVSVRDWFRLNVRPRLVNAMIRKRLAEASADPLAGKPAFDPAEVAATQDAYDDLQRTADELRKQIAAAGPAIEAAREAAGVSGAEDLALAYDDQAKMHHSAWRIWGVGLIVSIVVAIPVSVFVVLWKRPDGTITDAEVVGRLLLDLFVIGLVLYVVRVCSLQFRVHRHLEVVHRSKAAALKTFARLVAVGSDPAARDAVAVVLAQSVFSSDQSGFIDSTGDHITLIERVVGPVTQRATSSA